MKEHERSGGGLNGAQVEAAQAIRQAFRLITLPVSMRAGRVELGRGGGALAAGGAAGSAAVYDLGVVKRYLAWCDRMERTEAPIGLVLDFAVEELPVERLRTKYRIPRDRVLPTLRLALDLYWVRNRRN